MKISSIAILIIAILAIAIYAVFNFANPNFFSISITDNIQTIKTARPIKQLNNLILEKTQDRWEVFENREGNYQISYPSQLFFERNDTIGGNSKTYTQFHLLNVPDSVYGSITFNVGINQYLETWKKNHNGKIIQYGTPRREISEDHRIIKFGSQTADEYLYEDDGKIHMQTLFHVNGVPFTASSTYQKDLTSWPAMYRKMWTSIELLSK